MTSAETLEKQSATLAGLREYLPTIPDEKLRAQYERTYLSMLASTWIAKASKSSPAGFPNRSFPRRNSDPLIDGLANTTSGSEAGRWIEWQRKPLPAEQRISESRISSVSGSPIDYQAAMQWATTQPSGKDSNQVIQTIHASWPKEDPAGKEAFAKEHGLK